MKSVRAIILLGAVAVGVVACSAAWNDPRNWACEQGAVPSLRPMAWGYYPGYGCGPIPPAETHFS
jgi:hypothetical protein